MNTINLKMAESNGNKAVMHLRKAKFEKGLPFMINSKELPSKQCYLEYPDKRIELVGIKAGNDRDFTFIRELSAQEKSRIWSRFNFF